MKFIFCIAFLFMVVSSAETESTSLTQYAIPVTLRPTRDYVSDFSIFLENLFGHFGLDKPDQIIKCFDEDKIKLFCKSICTVNKVLQDSKERKGFATHMEFLKLQLINAGLESTYGCVMMTQDFTDLLDALKIDERDPFFFGFATYLYYQAFYPRLADDIQPFINAAKSKDFTSAGDLFGGLLETMVNEIKEDGFAFQAFSAFSNGAASELGLDFPNDSLQCHNDDSAMALLRFFYKLSVKVEQGGFKEAPLSTLNFWKDEGKAILDAIPQDVIDCNLQSQDITALSKRLGIRFGSKGFGEAVKRFITRHRITYFAAMRGIRASIEDHNFIHAGYTYGHLLDAFAKSLPYSEETQTLPEPVNT